MVHDLHICSRVVMTAYRLSSTCTLYKRAFLYLNTISHIWQI